MALMHAELVFIHPFRDGNGRVARWLADMMAIQAGYPSPLYRFEGRGSQAVRKRHLAVMWEGYMQRYDPLADFFLEAITLRLSG